ncbi:MAG: flagellar export chaperone FliS [Bryobacteraceae bacterium]
MNQRLAAYLEQRILSADPVELIRILYQQGLTEVREARRHLEARDIEARSKSISKSFEILCELSRSLDMDRGGEIAERLSGLYDYMRGRLLDANFQQADEPLAEVLSLLSTLAEAWESVKPLAPTLVATRANKGPVLVKAWTPEPVAEGWSLAG